MKNTNNLFAASLGLALADIFGLLMYSGGYFPNFVPIFLISASALFLVISGARTVTIYSATSNTGRSIFFLTLGAVICFFGEFYNFIKLFSGEGVKALSLADAFFYPAIICLVIGFYFAIKANKMAWTIKKKTTFITWAIILGILLAVVFYSALGKEFANIEISIGYFIISLVLAMMALRVFMVTWEYRGGSIFKAWFGIFFGMCLLIATTFYLFLTIEASLTNHNLTYISLSLLAISEIATAYGIMVLGSISKDAQVRILKKID